jgi:hypothetical protein
MNSSLTKNVDQCLSPKMLINEFISHQKFPMAGTPPHHVVVMRVGKILVNHLSLTKNLQ